jgi:uncharacterized protein YndB with AHSA1/START domain
VSHRRAGATAEGTVELARRIRADPSTVFTYFTDPERYRLWQGEEAELDPRPGGAFRVRMTGHSRQIVEGRYVEVDPPRRIVFTWGYRGNEGLPAGESRVEVVLRPDAEGTRLTVRHSGLPSDFACRFHHWGWDLTLDRLIAVAEGREPGPNPFATF